LRHVRSSHLPAGMHALHGDARVGHDRWLFDMWSEGEPVRLRKYLYVKGS
jgi:hypothetical protein